MLALISIFTIDIYITFPPNILYLLFITIGNFQHDDRDNYTRRIYILG